MNTYIPQDRPNYILCCICGVTIQSNPSNMCINCIKTQVDITEGIPKQLVIQWCRGCNRYLQPPNHWVLCELESSELLVLCIKRIKGLNKVKLVDASWVWTEPHSRRLKVKLTIQKEVFTSSILQQVFIVEFVVQGQQCDKCQKFEAKDTWNAVVQLRQKVDHKRTFLYIEQIILKHNAHTNTLNIKEKPDGLDFFFANRAHALKFVDFISAITPVRTKKSEQLISADEQSNTANYKHTFSVEIVPLSKDDIVCLPPKVCNALGNIGPIVVVTKVSNLIHFIDPNTLQTAEIAALTFWNCPFRPLSSYKQLVEFTCLDVTLLGETKGKHALSDVQLMRSADFGVNDNLYNVRSHLGNILSAGDLALGYDLSTTIFNDSDLAGLKSKNSLPDFVLVKKTYPGKDDFRFKRHWKLGNLPIEGIENPKKQDIERMERDKEDFNREIEGDHEMRSRINIYKEPNAKEIYESRLKKKQEIGIEDDEDEIKLEELLDQMDINNNTEFYDDEDYDDDDEEDDEDDKMDME
ncbi:60S ribosomal export protein [Tieghemostelium lacteum]|uniref:60S ribosomal export protein NMD3 n=1 Tax=Tieghemostelium lacteum TaxID=361077 RepID=A0A151ZJF7_TIELA|nr:60S ribosomal export protein [Tieghemostelium lacteum]|eukprot:KYQ94057.1 60S ribosomal export protein [Tieghemostelium lacteum]